MSYSITNGILSCTFSISDKNSSGQFTISATITTSSSTAGNPRLSCSLNDSSNWQRIGKSSMSAGSSYSGSTTFSTGNTGDDTVYCYLMSDYLSGIGGAYSVAGWEDPTPEMEPITLSISPTTQTMGQVVTVTESGGYYATVSQRQVRYNNSTIASYSSGNWKPSISTFEPYCTTSNSMTVQLRAYCTASSGAEGSGYSNTVSLTLNVPSNYLPTCSHSSEILNEVNGAIIGGQSGLKITLDPTVTPADNTATISSTALLSITPVPSTDTVPVTVSNFTKSGNEYTCSVLPTKANVPSYQFKMTFRITDSRGNVLDYETDAFRVSTFVPPLVTINNLNRTTATTGLLQITIDGESASNPSRIDSTSNTVANVIVSDGTTSSTLDIKSVLNESTSQTTKGYSFSYTIQNLSSGSQYSISFVYRDTTMVSYNESSYTYTQVLSTLGMPLSLYDDGTYRFASFGEECQNSYTGSSSDTVINFSMGSELRATNSGGTSVIKDAYDVVNAPTYIPTTLMGGLKFTTMTESEYQALTTKDANTIYFLTED